MAGVNKIRSWTSAILHLYSQEAYILMKVIMKCVNIKFLDILGCFHYILNAPRTTGSRPLAKNAYQKFIFLISQPKHVVVGTPRNGLNETALLSTQNKC